MDFAAGMDLTSGKHRNKNTIEYIIESPIRCGFLLAFCKLQFNIENLNFVIAVMKYKDIFSVDKMCWSKTWQILDAEVANQVFEIEDDENGQVESVWPSRKVNRTIAVGAMEQILDTYFNPDSPHEICVSAVIRENTFRRVKMLDVYGPQVFAQAILEPIQTMKKDILPRFLVSNHYLQMELRLKSCNPLPSASELAVPYPEESIINHSSLKDFPAERRFELIEVLGCKFLFSEFLLYLRQSMCTEDLLCYAMITKFENTFTSEETRDYSEEIMWNIYRFFIAPGSAYEISLRYSQKKIMMLALADPHPGIFDDVKRAVLAVLKNHFESFKATTEYENLSSHMAARLSSASLHGRVLSKLDCFG